MPEARRHERGVLDTSVIIDLDELDPLQLPISVAVSAITLAELAAGPHATDDPDERGRRQDRLQRAEATFDPLPFDVDAARLWPHLLVDGRRRAQGAGAHGVDLLMAATALAAELPLHPQR